MRQQPTEIPTAAGPGRIVWQAPDAPRAVLLLGHGAGGGIDAFDLATLAEGLPAHGVAVGRFEQPWVVAGRRVAGPPASLDRAWLPALDAVRAAYPGLPLFVGGRSAGARVACRMLPADAAGLVLLSFPLHPPGKPERSRGEELAAAASDAVILQGQRDPFGTPDELRAAVAAVAQAGSRAIHAVPGTHSLQPRSAAVRSAVVAALLAPVAGFVADRVPV